MKQSLRHLKIIELVKLKGYASTEELVIELEVSPQTIRRDLNILAEQDLIRRDLTINAIAQDKYGKLHDPYHGVEDIHQRILRHISPAYAEDPLRVLRVARFAARIHH